MAYPTTINFLVTSPLIGVQPIATTSTTQNHPAGTIVKAVDPVYGEGEFAYAQGVASTAAGDVCTYDPSGGPAVRAVAATKGQVGVAMSANLGSQWGWYQISGAAVVKSASATSGSVAGTSATAGSVGNTTTAQQVTGMKFAGAQDAPGAGYSVAVLSRPVADLLG